MVESQPSKLLVAGSIPVSHSRIEWLACASIMKFVQTPIAVEDAESFGQLRSMIDAALSPGSIDKFFKEMASHKVRIRDFEEVLQKDLLKTVRPAGGDASGIYNALSLPDRGQIREHYLTLVEDVDVKVRDRFKQLYRYA